MFSLLRVKTWVLLIFCLVHADPCMAQRPELLLNIVHGRSGEPLFSRTVRENDTIRLSWIHSVELTPWEEDYDILPDGGLLLKTARFTSYGAGVPEYGGSHRLKQGWIVRENIDRRIPALQWIHSRSARFQVHLNGILLLRPEDLPHHEPIKLFIKQDIEKEIP